MKLQEKRLGRNKLHIFFIFLVALKILVFVFNIAFLSTPLLLIETN